MRLSVQFYNRDGTTRIPPNGVKVSVEQYSRAAVGGPKYASLRIDGSLDNVWEFAEMLRCPIEIMDDKRAEVVWWGYLSEVSIYDKQTKFTISLDEMANKVAVAYTLNNERATTAWATNTDSTAEYGTKELLLTSSNLTDTQAQQYRDTELEARKYPVTSVPVIFSGGEVYGELVCRGWWSTLEWRHYTQLKGLEAFDDIDNWYGREIGEDGRPIAAQSFTVSATSNWDAESVWLRVRKVGSPADNLQVSVYTNSGGEPSVLQQTGTVAGGSIGTSTAWIEFSLGAAVTLTAGGTYWIYISRSGTVDADNYYIVDGNGSAAYSGGAMLIYNTAGSAWETWSYPCDINFRVTGTTTTTAQIGDIISDVGEFIVGSHIIDASGVSIVPYRSGDQTAQYELSALLDIGTTNDRRLLARVTRARQLWVEDEPARHEADYRMDKRGRIYDDNDNEILPSDCPAGMWLRYKDVIPATVNVSKLTNASYVFVEEAEYDAIRDIYKIVRTRTVDPFGLGTLRDRTPSAIAAELAPFIVDAVHNVIGDFGFGDSTYFTFTEPKISMFDISAGRERIYPFTAQGLDDSLAEAISGDRISLPAGTLSGNHTITAGVDVAGIGADSTILTGEITGGDGASLEGVTIQRRANDSNDLIAVKPPATGIFRIINCIIDVLQSGDGDAYGILSDVWGAIVEASSTVFDIFSALGDAFAAATGIGSTGTLSFDEAAVHLATGTTDVDYYYYNVWPYTAYGRMVENDYQGGGPTVFYKYIYNLTGVGNLAAGILHVTFETVLNSVSGELSETEVQLGYINASAYGTTISGGTTASEAQMPDNIGDRLRNVDGGVGAVTGGDYVFGFILGQSAQTWFEAAVKIVKIEWYTGGGYVELWPDGLGGEITISKSSIKSGDLKGDFTKIDDVRLDGIDQDMDVRLADGDILRSNAQNNAMGWMLGGR